MSGAAAVFDSAVPDEVFAIDLPTSGDGSMRSIAALKLAHWIDEYNPEFGFIELVTPGGGRNQGRGSSPTSGFRFGMGYGALRATVECCGVKYTLVVPPKWKKSYGLLGLSKDPDAKTHSREMATKLFPKSADLFVRVKDHQRAEAALIARYGARARGFVDPHPPAGALL